MSDHSAATRSARALRQKRLARSLIREAEEFCALIERLAAGSKRDIVRRLLRQLAALEHATVEAHARARLRTIIRGNDLGCLPRRQLEVPHSHWKSISSAVWAALGDRNAYWQYWDPLSPTPPRDMGPYYVSTDLIDMYIDIKSVMLQRTAMPDQDELATATLLLQDYHYHWGRHLISALGVLYLLDVDSRR